MRDVRNRQQPLLAAALFCVCAVTFAAAAENGDPVARELQALQLQGAALASRDATEDNWKNLEAGYASLVRRHPKNAALRDARGNFLWERNDREGAVREWNVAVRLEPKNTTVLNHLAGAHLAKGDPKEALGYYIRSVEAEPRDAHTHFSTANVAWMFRHEVGRTESECVDLALRHFAEAHRLAPTNPEFARGYAETFYLIPHPDWTTALKVWTAYLNLMPEKDFALLNLARVHLNLGDAGNARACLAQVTNPANERLKKRLEARIQAELSSEKPPSAPEVEKSLKPSIDEGRLAP